MAVIDNYLGNPNLLLLVRNHEAGGGAPYVNRPAITYLSDGAGGTTNLIFDTQRRALAEVLELACRDHPQLRRRRDAMG